MNKSIENLMNEHRLIEQVLGSLQTFANTLRTTPTLDRGELVRYARFFQRFADKCHHGKEEDKLFVKMTEVGFSREMGPIGVMLFEHDAGRNHVRALAAIGSGTGPLLPDEIEQAVANAEAFILLLSAHIQKEDMVLYPMAMQTIPPEELAALDADCDAYDRDMTGSGEVDQLKLLARELLAAYPPSKVEVSECGFCGGH